VSASNKNGFPYPAVNRISKSFLTVHMMLSVQNFNTTSVCKWPIKATSIVLASGASFEITIPTWEKKVCQFFQLAKACERPIPKATTADNPLACITWSSRRTLPMLGLILCRIRAISHLCLHEVAMPTRAKLPYVPRISCSIFRQTEPITAATFALTRRRA
jgi:hypothetical protein